MQVKKLKWENCGAFLRAVVLGVAFMGRYSTGLQFRVTSDVFIIFSPLDVLVYRISYVLSVLGLQAGVDSGAWRSLTLVYRR